MKKGLWMVAVACLAVGIQADHRAPCTRSAVAAPDMGAPPPPGAPEETVKMAAGEDPEPASRPAPSPRRTPLPDFAVYGSQVVVNIFVIGGVQVASLSAVVRNFGTVESPPAKVKLTVQGSAVWIYTKALPAIPPGGSAIVSVNNKRLAKERMKITVKADPRDKVEELYEDNNKAVVWR